MAEEDLKKNRSARGGTVTRRVKELLGAIRLSSTTMELKEKIQKVKESMEALGEAQDAYVSLLGEDQANMDAADGWYYEYDDRVNQAIMKANLLMDPSAGIKGKTPVSVKIEKLQLPKFNSSPKNYFKWKSTFERYLQGYDEKAKYDYLLSHTTGRANKYVASKSTYLEAIGILEDKYGNKHVILKMLLEEIRSLAVAKKGDFDAFENLAFKASTFCDRLIEMNMDSEVESSYILHELESKMNAEDIQRWLESCETVDERKVAGLVSWLDKQTHVRKLTQFASKTSPNR